MDVGTPLIANLQTTKAVEPGQCPLDNPAVPIEAFRGLDATLSDAWDFVPILRVGAGFLAPPGAGTLALSSDAGDRSI